MKSINLKLKTSLYFLTAFFAFFSAFTYTQAAPAWVSSDSPIARGEHPRMHIIPDPASGPDKNVRSSIEYFRDKVSRTKAQGGYREEFQTLVNFVDGNFNSQEVDGALMADYHALIYLLGDVNGISYGNQISDYGNRAIQIALNKVAEPLPANYTKAGHDFHDPYSTVARAYDWTYDRLSSSEKSTIGNWLATVGNKMATGKYSSKGITNSGTIGGLFSSSYGEIVQPYYIGLAFYGDGIDANTENLLLNSFDKLMLNGKWLDAQNWVARDAGGPSEVGSYGGWHPHRHIMNIDVWRTATGIDYFAKGTNAFNEPYSFQYYPQYVAYFLSPGDPSLMLKWGQGGVEVKIPNSLHTLGTLGEALKYTDSNMASLNRWIIERPTSFERYYNIDEKFFRILLGDRTVAPRTPDNDGDSLTLPLTKHFEGIGYVIMRTGFNNKDDAVFVVGGPEYQLYGHTWGSAGGGTKSAVPIGFTLNRFGGPLALNKKSRHRGCANEACEYENAMRFNDPAMLSTDIDGGFNQKISEEVKDFRDYTINSKWYRGGILRLKSQNNFDYVYSDLGRNYLTNRISKYTRQYFYLRPNNLSNSDYIVIFDRVKTANPNIIKRWIVNSAYSPNINGNSNNIRNGKVEYSNADLVTITNDAGTDPYSGVDNGGHGKLFVKKLLPKNSKVIKYGGPGREFEDDLGNNIGVSGDYSNLNKYGAFYTGLYRTEIVSTNQNTDENFLNVLQSADTNNGAQSSQMVQTKLIESSNLQGAFIEGTSASGQSHSVVMFAKNEKVLDPGIDTVSYQYGSGFNGNVNHFIADIKPGTYDIVDTNLNNGQKATKTVSVSDARNGNGIEVQISQAGVLTFSTNASSPHEIQVVASGAAPPPPLTCTSFTYSSWSPVTCPVNQTQTRTVLTSSPSGCTGGDPVLTQSCTYIPPPTQDTTAPSTPTNLQASAVSSSQIDLSWSASTDNVGVTGYNIYRGGTQITTVTGTSYQNTNLQSSTTYSYTVSAIDAAGNSSNQTSSVTTTTQSGTTPPPPQSNTIFSTADTYLGDSLNWEPLTPSRWNIISDGGDLRYGINTTDHSHLPGERLGEYSLIRNRIYNDFIFTANVKSTEDLTTNSAADYNVIFNYQDPNNYYYMMFNSNPIFSQLFKVVDGQRQLIADASNISIQDNNYHGIKIEKTGTTIMVFFDNTLGMTATDSTFSSGQIGIGGYNDASLWDDIVVTTPTPSTTLRGDLDGNGIINTLDWSIMNSRWNTNDTTVDLNDDGIINTIDFSIMNNNWSG